MYILIMYMRNMFLKLKGVVVFLKILLFSKTCAIQTINFFGKVLFSIIDNKQLLDEVEHDIMNYQNRGLCYLPKPKAEADNTDTRF